MRLNAGDNGQLENSISRGLEKNLLALEHWLWTRENEKICDKQTPNIPGLLSYYAEQNNQGKEHEEDKMGEYQGNLV